VQVQVAHPQALADVLGQRLALDRGEQRVEVQRPGPPVVAEAGRPVLALAVPGELDAVAVEVRQVDRLVRAVVGGALDGRAGRGEADGGARVG
jgi:DNA-binding IclR family transcriptional regulator